ncbi:MAG: hypothetical protein AAGF79_14155 [Pseudomonadota bacterium]
MRKSILIAALTLVTATSVSAQEWLDELILPYNSSITSLTRALNCQSWTLSSTSQRAPMAGALASWVVFNEGPAPVAVRGPQGRSREIPVFSGTIYSVHGEFDEHYTIGTTQPGGTRVHVCRV